MIGKVIGAIAGAQASKYSKAVGGTSGAVIGALAVPVISRMRWPALLALTAGGYLAKKLIDKDHEVQPSQPEEVRKKPAAKRAA